MPSTASLPWRLLQPNRRRNRFEMVIVRVPQEAIGVVVEKRRQDMHIHVAEPTTKKRDFWLAEYREPPRTSSTTKPTPESILNGHRESTTRSDWRSSCKKSTRCAYSCRRANYQKTRVQTWRAPGAPKDIFYNKIKDGVVSKWSSRVFFQKRNVTFGWEVKYQSTNRADIVSHINLLWK